MDHAGFGLRMASEHVPLWQAYVQAVEAEAATNLSEAEARTEQARRQLEARPERVVEKYLNEADIVAAKHQAQRAYTSREYAWQALSALGLLHVEQPEGQCRCGKVRRSCAEAQLVNGVNGLRQWEARQAEAHRQGHRHYLPDGHPALIDYRWQAGVEAEDWDDQAS
jgi:hypothetical protein